MSFSDAVKSVFSKYAEFSGRARRSEYWYFVLFNGLVGFAIGFVGGIILGERLTNIVSTLYSLAVLVPSLAVGVRRLHDTGRSAWRYLFLLIPFVGWIILVVFLAQDSQPGVNVYGPNPKETSVYS